MKWAWIVLGVIILVVIGLFVYLDSKRNGNESVAKPEGFCSADSDCIKDTCCHAKSCTNKENAPSCKGIMCTAFCEPETLDCGGSCKCVNNKCEGVELFAAS
jgi:hypothetical protein